MDGCGGMDKQRGRGRERGTERHGMMDRGVGRQTERETERETAGGEEQRDRQIEGDILDRG